MNRKGTILTRPTLGQFQVRKNTTSSPAKPGGRLSNYRTMKKSIAGAAVLVFLVLVAAGISTGKGFNDQEITSENTFESGSLDLKIGWKEYIGEFPVEEQTITDNPEPIFNVTGIQSGDYGKSAIDIHLFDNSGWVWLEVDQTGNSENGNLSSENDLDSGGELGQHLNFLLWYDDGDDIRQEDEKIIFNGTAHELGTREEFQIDSEPETETVQPFMPSVTRSIGIQWSMEDTACNVQTDSKTFELEFSTQQERHNPSPVKNNFYFTDAETSSSNYFQAGEFPSCQTQRVCSSVEGLKDGRTYSAKRIADTNTTVNYTVEMEDNSSVKFEEATLNGSESGLGEEGEVESDIFEISVEGGTDMVYAEIKAGQKGAKPGKGRSGGNGGNILLQGEGDTGMESEGLFKFELLNITENGSQTVYKIKVTSDSEEGKDSPALSYVKFEFCNFKFQADLAGGEPIQNLSETRYHDEDRMISYVHGNTEEGITSPTGTPEQVDCVESSGLMYNKTKKEIKAEFEVSNQSTCKPPKKISLTTYAKPFAGWIDGRAGEQMLYDSETLNATSGNHSLTAKVPPN